MSTITTPRATLADLAKVTEKAELIAGRIEPLMPTGRRPNRVAGRIYRSLDDFAEATGLGEAYTDNAGFAVTELSTGRESFSPDASFFTGAAPENDMAFLQGAPIFAVEVRSDGDYGASAEKKIAQKRAEYFEAGTRVVWDVDPVNNMISSYTSQDPDRAIVFRGKGQAHAEPAVPGWRVDIEQIFRE